jgi:uncharacterized paraquat-inducible protein A
MSLISSLVVTAFSVLPWLAVGAVAALALRRQKNSLPLMTQCGAALALFLLPLARWLLVDLFLSALIKAGPKILEAAHIIFGFLLFLSLAAFALGYCLERLARSKPAQVTATPAS